MNIIRIILKVVVHASSQRIHAVGDHIIDLHLQLLLGQIQMKAILERAHNARSALLKAGQLRAQLHDLNNGQELVHVFAGGQESLEHQNLKIGEHVTLYSTHHFDKLVGHFKCWALEAQILRRRGQHEAVVDVDQVALIIE